MRTICSAFCLLQVLTALPLMGQTKPKPRPAPAANPGFMGRVLPIFKADCIPCHNTKTLGVPTLSGGLALDTFEAVMAGVSKPGGAKEAVVLAGQPEKSSLYERLMAKEASRRMPKGGDPLPPAKIAVVRDWIASGAPKGTVVATSAMAKPAPAPPPPMLDVFLPTELAAPARLRPKGAPENAKLSLRLPAGPLSPVTALAYSPNGKLLAIGGYRSVVIWDIEKLEPARALTDFVGQVQGLAWSPDGKLLAVAGGEPGVSGEVKVLDATAAFAQRATFEGHADVVYDVSFGNGSEMAATASHDKTVRIWEVATGKNLQTIKTHSDVVYRVRFVPNSTEIVTASQDRSVRRFDAKTGKVIRAYEGHGAPVLALALSADGSALVTAGNEPRLRWWNPREGNTIQQMDAHRNQVIALAFSPDKKWLASGGADAQARLWNGSNGQHIRAFAETPGWIYTLAFSADSRTLASGGGDGLVHLWDTESGEARGSVLVFAEGKTLEWLLMSRAGYVAASPGWTKRMGLGIAGAAAGKPNDPVLAALGQADQARKSVRGEKVEPPKVD